MPGGKPNRIWMGGLDADTRESDIEGFLKDFGKLKEVYLKKMYAFVEFEDEQDAEDAVKELNDKTLMGKNVKLEFTNRKRYEDRSSRSKSPPRGRGRERGEGGGRGAPEVYYRLKIKNLTTRFDWRELKDFFREKVGGVTYTEAHTDRENTGVVEFRHKSDAMRAYDRYDDYDINGRRIELKPLFSTRRSRSRSRSRGRRSGRGRSRSRRRSYSRSRSRTRSRSRRRSRRSRSRTRSRSRSPVKRERSYTRSRDPSKDRSRSRGRSYTRSRSR